MKSRYLKITSVLLLLCQVTFAQKFETDQKPLLLGFSGNIVDFSASLPDVGKVDPSASLFFWKGLNKYIDISGRYNAIFSNYAKHGVTNYHGILNELEASLHARPMADNHIVSPFLTAGIGAGIYGKKAFAPYVPLGAGLQFNLYNETYIFLQGNYRLSLKKDKLDNNTFFSLGFAQPLGEFKKIEAPKPLPMPVVYEVKDTDKDNVPDSIDACPTVAGLPALAGCPDKDGDGIADKDDKCADVAGLKKYDGCPIPDTDKDGVNDEEDKCPNEPGVAKYGGCPIPDTDKDGVNDEEDQCISLPGTAANKGCPEIKEEVRKRIDVAAKKIYFATGSAKLLAKSNASLNEAYKILAADENLKMDINGYTDNTGKAEKNKTLSENRAKAVYDYLVKKGIATNRLISAGFGQENPIADNKTAAGRSKNRRVELDLHYN